MDKTFTITGKMSFFGGPYDDGVAASEDLALYESNGIAHAPAGMFLPVQPEGTTGTARRLNPGFPYIAMRWAYSDKEKSVALHDRHGQLLGVCLPVATSRSHLLSTPVLISNPKRRDLKPVKAYPADWGPNSDTSRVADLAPYFAEALGLQTDDMVTIIIPLEP